MTVMRQIFSAIAAVALSVQVGTAQSGVAPIASTSVPWETLHSPSLNAMHRFPTADSARQSSRRSTVAGAVAGAVIGGLATAGFVLNATAYDCVYSVSVGPPCPKKNYVVLHTVTIAAGATAGAFIGIKIAHWVSRRL